MLLSTLMESNTPEEWKENLIQKWFVHFGDDSTMTILTVGFEHFSDLKMFYQERLNIIEKTYGKSFSDEMNVQEREQLWQIYRKNYYRFENEDVRKEQ